MLNCGGPIDARYIPGNAGYLRGRSKRKGEVGGKRGIVMRGGGRERGGRRGRRRDPALRGNTGYPCGRREGKGGAVPQIKRVWPSFVLSIEHRDWQIAGRVVSLLTYK